MLVHLWQPRATEATARGRERESLGVWVTHTELCEDIFPVLYARFRLSVMC